MKIIAIMPIKMNNERCPGKNTRLLGDKPLLQYELNSLLQMNMIDEIDVYCSNEAIIPFLPAGVNYVKRSEELDSPLTNFTQIFSAFSKEHKADIYIFAHATAPFIKVSTINECLDAVLSGNFDSAFCAKKIQSFLWQDGKPMNFDAANLPRTQDLVPVYEETSGVYVFKSEVFEKYSRRVGIHPYIKCVDVMESVDIDTPEDFAFAELIRKIMGE